MKRHKSTLIIVAALALCLLGIAVVLPLAREQQRQLLQMQAEAELAIIAPDGGRTVLSYEQIRALPAAEFAAIIRASGQRPEDAVYTGAALADVLALAGLEQADIVDCRRMAVTAADGYIASFRLADVLAADNIYLAYMQDGELMRPRGQGGFGPYQLIARQDSFSQRWAKYVVEIKFERE